MSDPQSAVPVVPGEQPTPIRKWGGGDVAIGMAIALFASGVFGMAYDFGAGGSSDERTFGLTMASFLGLWVGWLGWPVAASFAKGARNLATDYGLTFKWQDIPIGIFVSLSGTFLTVLVYLPLQFFNSDLADQVSDPAESLSNLASGLWIIPLYLAICIGAPFVEEVFFRGLTLRAFSYRFGSTAGIIGSSVLFGLIHLEPLQTPALIGFGLILAYTARRTGRIGAPIIGHCLFNATSLAVLSVG